MFVTERSIDVAERSSERKSSDLEACKLGVFRGLEIHNVVKFGSQVSKCSLATENALKMQDLKDFLESPAPPKPPIRTYVGMWIARQSAGALCFLLVKST